MVVIPSKPTSTSKPSKKSSSASKITVVVTPSAKPSESVVPVFERKRIDGQEHLVRKGVKGEGDNRFGHQEKVLLIINYDYLFTGKEKEWQAKRAGYKICIIFGERTYAS